MNPQKDPFNHDGLMGLYTIFQRLENDTRNHAMQLARLEAQSAEGTKSLDTLNRLLRDGDGTRSVLTRLEVMEDNLKDTGEAARSLRTDIAALRSELAATRGEDTRGRLTIANSVVTGILSIIAALLTALVARLVLKPIP